MEHTSATQNFPDPIRGSNAVVGCAYVLLVGCWGLGQPHAEYTHAYHVMQLNKTKQTEPRHHLMGLVVSRESRLYHLVQVHKHEAYWQEVRTAY